MEGINEPAFGRQLFQGFDASGLNKPSLCSWNYIHESGNSKINMADKLTMMSRYVLPTRDLPLLEPMHPSIVLGREQAIIVNLEPIRGLIAVDHVLLLDPCDDYVLQYEVELKKRLSSRRGGRNVGSMFGNTSPDCLIFSVLALEVALEAACTFLDSQVAELENEAYPLLDELTSNISTLNLVRSRRLQSRLLALTQKVEKVRDEIKQLMDDDKHMDEMCITQKGNRSAASVGTHQSSKAYGRFLRQIIEELEMLFVGLDRTLNKLTTLKKYIAESEDFINIKLDDVRNQRMQFDQLLPPATFVVTIFGVVAGIFGMNFALPLFGDPAAFKWVLIITGVVGICIYFAFLRFFKYRRFYT